jgi:hypothetical protein
MFLPGSNPFISNTNGQDTVSAKLNQTGDTTVLHLDSSSAYSGRNVAKIDSTKYQPAIAPGINITGNKMGHLTKPCLKKMLRLLSLESGPYTKVTGALFTMAAGSVQRNRPLAASTQMNQFKGRDALFE